VANDIGSISVDGLCRDWEDLFL